MTLDQIMTTAFLVALLTSAIRLATPILLAVLGEIITEKSGVLNLGLEGIMLMGALCGFWVTWLLEAAMVNTDAAAWIGLLGGAGAGAVAAGVRQGT